MESWNPYWERMRNLHWGELDKELLRVMGDVLGWGPQRSLCELGGGRGLHSRMLYHAGRCESLITIVDPSSTARCLAAHNGNVPYENVDVMPKGSEFDIVWSSGLVEHFEGEERQAIVDQHFELAKEEVVIVVPVQNLQRRLFPPKKTTPWSRLYTRDELSERLRLGASKHWSSPSGKFTSHITLMSLAPLFGVPHIPDAVYPTLTTLTRRFLRGGLLLGHARRA